MVETTTVQLTEEVRDRLRACKVGGENYSNTVDRLISTAVGYQSGEKVTAKNVSSTRIRLKRDEDWIDPDEEFEIWSQDPALLAAKQQGRVEVVDR